MNRSVIRCIAILIALLVAGTVSADRRKTSYVPANHPDFTLLETSDSHARLQYTFPGEEQSGNKNKRIYVGIPPEAGYEVSILSWKYTIEYRGTVQEHIEGSLDTIGNATRPLALLESVITSNRLSYHEIDAIALEVDPITDSAEDRHRPTHQRPRVHIHSLVFDVTWTPTGASPLATPPRTDAGFSRLLSSFCINSDQVNSLRRKRPLPDEIRLNETLPLSGAAAGPDELVDPHWKDQAPREDAVRIETRGFGIRALRADDLEDTGIDPATINLDQLRLWRNGTEQPLSLIDSDGVFSEDDVILFYVETANSEFTKNNIDYLTWDTRDTAPLRVTSEPMTPSDTGADIVHERIRFNDDDLLVKHGLNDYAWYHDEVDSVTKVFPLALPSLASRGEIQIEVSYFNRLRKASTIDFHFGDTTRTVLAQVNQATSAVLLSSHEFWPEEPLLEIELEDAPPTRTGLSGTSDKIGDVYHLFLEWIEVKYPRPLELGTSEILFHAADNPVDALSIRPPRRYRERQQIMGYIRNQQLVAQTLLPQATGPFSLELAPVGWDMIVLNALDDLPGPVAVHRDYHSTLRAPDQGYDYVILAHHSMIEEAIPLAERRQEDGFHVLLTDVQDIYDEFNHGYPGTDAIKRFLQYGQSAWTGRSPEFVVFIGDSSWDHKDRENTGYEDQIPTYAPMDNPQRFGSDQWYGYLWGGVNDECLDLILGRISVRTPDELQHYLTKLALYEDESPVGLWKARNLFITDDGFDRYAREQGDESTPLPFHSTYVIQTDYPHVTNPYLFHRFMNDTSPGAREYTNKKYSPQCTLAILDAMNQGVLVLQYVGHGGNQMWSHERIFYGTDRPTSNVLELEPNTRFPFIINWSCLTGYLNFNRPPFHVCLAEEFLRYPDRGGIAIWAPSGGGTTDQHMVLSHMVMRNLVHEGMTRIGEATSMTKTEFLQISHTKDLVDQYTVFGDPAVELAMPAHTVELAVSPKTYFADRQQEFTVNASTAPLQEGMAWIAMSVKGTVIHESHPFAFQDGHIEYAFSTMPPEASIEGAKIRIYIWNEETGEDAWGGFTIDEFRPVLALGEPEFRHDDSQIHVTFDVTNDSPVDVTDMAIHWMQNNTTHELAHVDVGAESTTSVNASFQPTEESSVAYILIPAQENLAIEATPNAERLVIPVYDESRPAVVPLVGQVHFTSQELFAGSQARVRIPVQNISNATKEIRFSPPDTSTHETIREATFPPQNLRSYDYNVVFPEPGLQTMTFALHVDGATTTYSVDVDVLGQPDLALAEGDYTISPDPAIIGHTVTIRTHVYNFGDGPATNIKIEAYIGDPAMRTRITRFNKRSPESIDRIEPGAMKEIEIIWDPTSYEGLGSNQIYIVADPVNRITELDETNNQLPITVVLHDLPDVTVDPWVDHKLTLREDADIPVWGSPMRLSGRIRNVGDTDATYARISLVHNENELTAFADRIKPGAFTETHFEVPLVSSKNTLVLSADKYNLIAEKGETLESRDNDSSPKRFDFLLQMPEAPLVNNKRVYVTESETHFTAGEAEWFSYDKEDRSLILSRSVLNYNHRIAPWFVDDEDSYVIGTNEQRWQWNPQYTSFFNPTQSDDILQVGIPVVRGTYDVAIQLNSSRYVQTPTATIQIKTQNDTDFIAYDHFRGGAEHNYYPLGTMNIESDRFVMDFRRDPDRTSTELGNVRFIRSPNTPLTAVYVSPLFPTSGTNGGPIRLTWNADIPDNTGLQLRVRWVRIEDDGSLRYLPWMRTTDGAEQELEFRGSGDYMQYSAWFTLEQDEFASPALSTVRLEVPFANGKALSQGDR